MSKKIEVLILADNSSLSAIASTLEQSNFQFNWRQTTSIEEYQTILSSQLDLVIYDAYLSQIALAEAIALLSANNLKIPFIVVNGSSIPAAVAAIKAGATDYLAAEALAELPQAIANALLTSDSLCRQSQCESDLEQQLQKLITENADGIIVVDERGIVKLVNPAALELFGKSSTELIGESLGFPVVNGDFLEVDLPVSANGSAIAQMRVSQIKWQGSDAFIVSLRDITQLKQAESERAKLLEEAQAANRAKDEFLAILSHELRTPLNPIVGWSQLLVKGNLKPAQIKQGAEIIQRNAMLQTKLIDDILDISRIIRGKLKLQAVPTNLADIVRDALDTVNLAAQTKSIQIETNLDDNIGLVQGDHTRLQQVVWNLLSNAVKFTPSQGKVEVTLTNGHPQAPSCLGEHSLAPYVDAGSRRFYKSALPGVSPGIYPGRGGVRVTGEKRQSASYALMKIKDSGKGIAPEFLPHVFDHFRQAESTKSRSEGGLGLGLAIVRRLVELHGGEVAASSPGLGKGATFTIFLPLLNTTEETITERSPKNIKNLAQIKALVVDDDDDSRNLISYVLKTEGAGIEVAKSPTEALSLIERFQPDVLISDIGMPQMNGYELIQKIRQLPPDRGGKVMAIAISGYASEQDRQKSLEAGFERHINKPLDVNYLIKVIAQLVNKYP